jgi:hypothetical protein
LQLSEKKSRLRAATAFELFKEDLIKRDQFMGRIVHVTSEEFRQLALVEWAALSPVDVEDYESLAKSSKLEAARARDAKRHS